VIVVLQVGLSVETGLGEARDEETRDVIFQQVLGLADIVLQGFTDQLASVRGKADQTQYADQLSQQYTQQRHALIKPFCR